MNRPGCISLSLTASLLVLLLPLEKTSPKALANTSSKNPLKHHMNDEFAQKHYKRSYTYASEVLKIDPDDTDALVIKGCSLTAQRRPREAEPLFRRAMQLKPRRVDYIAHHIADLIFLERYDEAKKELPILYAIDPKFDYGNVLDVKIDIHQQRYTMALEKSTKLLLARTSIIETLACELAGHWEIIKFGGVPKRTIALFASALEQRAEKNIAHADYLRALAYVRLGRYVDASNVALRLAHTAPDLRYHLNIMHLLTLSGHRAEALKCLPVTGEEALDPQTVSSRVNLLAGLGKTVEALELCIKQGAAFAVKNKMFGAISEWLKALSDSDRQNLITTLQSQDKPDWLVFLIAAMIFHKQQDYENAIQAYENAFQNSGQNSEVALEYCTFLVQQRKFKESLIVLQQVRNPGEALIPIHARILVLLKKPNEAIEMVQANAVKNHSSKSEALLGDLYRQLGRPMEALAHYNRAIELEPKSAYLRQRRLDFARLIRRYDIVCMEIDQSLKKDPNNYRLYCQKALYEELSGHSDSAISAWNRALALKINRR